MTIKKQLDSHPAQTVHEVSFCELIRCVERETGLRLGSDLDPSLEPIVLKADSDLLFSATEVTHWNSDAKTPEVKVAFFGLFGPSGALPYHYTQIIRDQARIKDFALRDFLDMFNHRLISFFYRCWEKNQFPITFETSQAAGREDHVTGILRALSGLRADGVWDRLSIPSSDLLFFSGHFAHGRPTAQSLCQIVQEAFAVPAQVVQFVPQWLDITPEEQTRIGVAPMGVSLGNDLGIDTIIGERVLDFQNRFRIRIGPLGFEKFTEFSPEGPRLRQVVDYLRSYVGPQYDFEIQLVLKRDEVVTSQFENPNSAMLGWNTWIGDWTETHDPDDALYELPDVVGQVPFP